VEVERRQLRLKRAPESPGTGRLPSVDTFRVVAVLGVLTIHSYPNHGSADYTPGERLAAAVLDQVSRFAVPFFFTTSGFFLGRRLREGRTASDLLFSSTRRLATAFLVWSCVYLAWDSARAMVRAAGAGQVTVSAAFEGPVAYARVLASDPVNGLLTGPRCHLWFLPALWVAVAVTCAGEALGSRGLLGACAVALYVVGLAAGSYAPLSGVDVPVNTRNGPFFSLLFTYLGFLIALKGWRLPAKWACLIVVGGWLIQATEVVLLKLACGVSPFRHDFLAGTVLVGFGAVQLALACPVLGERAWLPRMGSLALGIYASHVLFQEAFSGLNFVRGILGQIVLVGLSFLASLAVSGALARQRLGRRLVS
jgi:surface polysaccharide O-acyltransferase-like enzyme